MIDSLEIEKRMERIYDGGPIYNEFIHDAVVHEPWNAYSSLFFFIPIFFWIWKLYGQYSKHWIIVVLLPLLFLNGLGSTLFHAFRVSPWLLLLDWLPASLMSITLATYFWTKVVKKWYFGFLCVLAFYGMAVMFFASINPNSQLGKFAPNIGYFFVGCSLFVPIVIDLFKNKFKDWVLVLLTIVFLVSALLCRALDYPSPNPFPKLIPQGSHFLWHIFSSFAVFSLGFYIYRSNLARLEKEK